MTSHDNRRTFFLIALLAVASMVFAACAAPAAAPATGGEQPAAAPSSDLPAEAGRGTDGTVTLVYWQEVSILNPYLAYHRNRAEGHRRACQYRRQIACCRDRNPHRIVK